jgi:hypothetical protein
VNLGEDFGEHRPYLICAAEAPVKLTYAKFEKDTGNTVEARMTRKAALRLAPKPCYTAGRWGCICCPSDHLFFGDPANQQAFVEARRECRY